MTPLRPVLTSQPTEPGTPWSARHAQMWSMSTSSLLTSRLTSALPTCGPPTRKYTSLSVVGSAGSLLWLLPCALPTRSSAGELTGPASTVTPATTTPGTSATVSGTEPPTAVRVAWPSPRTTVPARLTSMLRSTSYTPG